MSSPWKTAAAWALAMGILTSGLAAAAEPLPESQGELVIEGAGSKAAAPDEGPVAQPAVVDPVGDAREDAAVEASADLPERGPEELFVLAGQAYEEGDYAAAAELYRRLIDTGFDNGHLHYNLGNARLRNGELGRAIAAYREARLRLPRDREIIANLDFARKSTKDALMPPEPAAVLATLFFWHYELSSRELAIAAVFLGLLFWGALTGLLFRPGSEPLRWLSLALLVPLVAVGGSLAVRELVPVRVGVVIPQEASAHTAPRPDAVVRFKLHAGTEIRVRERADGWLRIALPDGQEGWIEGAQIVTVSG